MTSQRAIHSPRIALLTLFTPDVAAIGDISVRNKRTYCDLHDYELIVERASLDVTRPPHWSKLLAIRNHLHRFDWLFWTDHDSLIMSFRHRLQDLCDDNFDLLITQDSLGLNTGQMLFRNTPASLRFLALAYQQTQFIGHIVHEQAAVAHLLSRHPDLLRVKICPQRTFNSYPENYQPGDFLLHFAGPYNKLANMRSYQSQADILIAPGEDLALFLHRLQPAHSITDADPAQLQKLYDSLPPGSLFSGHAANLAPVQNLAKQHDLTIYLSDESLNLWHCIKSPPRRHLHGPAIIQRKIPRIDHIASEMRRAARLAKSAMLKEADEIYRAILLAHPNHAEAMHRLAWLCREQGYYHESIDLFTAALKLRPNESEWHNDLGSILFSHGMHERAAHHFTQAAELRQDHPTALANLAVVREQQGRLDDAIAAYREALRRRAPDPARLNDLAILLTRRCRFDEAISAARHALQLDPNSAESHNNLAVALLQAGRVDQALRAFDEALRHQPHNDQLRGNRGMALLLTGDLQSGWPEYSARWNNSAHDSRFSSLGKPRWQGQDIRGKTILLWEDEGFGDVFQFVRYIPLLAQLGAKVMLKTLPRLAQVLAGVNGLSQVVGPKDPLPNFDLHAPLIEMPVRFRTSLSTIPANVPYISADPALIDRWRNQFPQPDHFKIGIAWRCDPRHTNADRRSIPLRNFSQLSKLPNVTLISLQRGPGVEEIEGAAFPIIELGPHADSTSAFADTAAVIADLDLVITADTSIAHLAGAMNVSTWVLLPITPEWRWLLDRADSPWYPSIKLFRQKKWWNWQDVFDDVMHELRGKQT